MARRDYQEMLEAVTAAIVAAGGTITHNALVELLDSDTARQLMRMQHAGEIVPAVTAQPNGGVELSYTVGGAN